MKQERTMKKRRSIQEINKDMDIITKRKPSKDQIEDLARVIKKINEEERSSNESEEIPVRKIAISNDNSGAEINGQ
jgi:hypothetical protein